MTGLENPLIRFSLTLYGEPGVEQACLTLQDDHGLDIPIILLCAWVGRYGVKLSQDSLHRIDAAIRPWRDTVVVPLRSMRRRLKMDLGGIDADTAMDLRRQIKDAELSAELLALDHLYKLMAHVTASDGREAERGGLIRGNLILYAANCGVTGTVLPRTALETIVQSAAELPHQAG